MMKIQKRYLISLVLILLCSSVSAAPPLDIKIEFTEVPKSGAGANTQGNIAGKVSGLPNPQDYKIVLYAHTNLWYVQPLTIEPFTEISRDGHWSNWTHLGRRYAALVVRNSFEPKAKIMTLPLVGGDVVARGETSSSQ